MAATQRIIDLRNLLAERFQQPPALTGGQIKVPLLERIPEAGLRKGAITEIISPNPSAGSALLIHSLLQIAQRDRFFLALIDGSDSFDIYDSGALQHLLWVRCEKASEALKAADFLLRDGNFPLVILDLGLNAPEELRNIPQTNWYRLQRLAEAVPSACLVMNRHSMVGSAQLKIVLENSWTLESMKRKDAVSKLRFRIERSHVGRDIALRCIASATAPRGPFLATAS